MAADQRENLAGEREVLARIVTEIDYVKNMADEAKSQSHDLDRVRFQYDWFQRDLERVKQGILDYLYGPNNSAVTVPALRGDYRH